MPTEQERNKEITVRFYDEIFNQHNVDVADELWADDHSTTRDMLAGETNEDAAETKAYLQELLDAFPDMTAEFEYVVAEDDKVVVRWIKRATHLGELKGIEPTGKEVEWTGFALVRLEDGKIVEGVSNWDTLGLLQQLGVGPEL